MSGFGKCVCVLLAVFGTSFARAQILRLPTSACALASESADGFEAVLDSWPSRGSGGALGAGNAFVSVPGFESDPHFNQREYFYFVPELATPRPLPVVVALHGTAGSPTNARTEARVVRDIWIDAATRYGFAVIAPVAGSTLGSWTAPDAAGARPTDYDVIAAAMAHLESRYDIQRLRRYLWGFSAGGHVGLDVILNPWHEGFDRRNFAAVAINAGALAGLACAGVSTTQCDLALHDAFPRLPLQVIAGDTDPLATRVLQDAPRFRNGGWIDGRNYRLETFAGGHYVQLTHPEQQWLWLCQFSRRLDPIERFRLRPNVP